MTLQAIKTSVMKFVEDEEGLTTVEYAVAGALVAGALIVAFTDLGTAVGLTIQDLCEALDAGGTCSGAS
jgi:pilus assembly protein Flp/PilA